MGEQPDPPSNLPLALTVLAAVILGSAAWFWVLFLR